jgi:uroporphyrinogen-III synthase
MRVLITRPQEDGEAVAALLGRAGHQPMLAPLLRPRWLDGPVLDLSGIAAFLATSANGVRALARRTPRRDIPVLAVGPQTAEEARAAGFLRVENADGDALALADAVPRWLAPAAGILLHVCGAEAAGTLAERLAARGYEVRREILYAVQPLTLSPQAAAALAAGAMDAVLLFSPRSARIFIAESQALDLSGITAFCISPATAAALPQDRFAAIRVAARPNQESLVALLA